MPVHHTNQKVVIAITLNVEYCAECGVPFGVPSELIARRMNDGEDYYCPNGHCQAFEPKADAVTSATDASGKPVPPPDERQRKIMELHELEQAEARNAERQKDRKKDRKKVNDPATEINSLVCPKCQKRFKGARWLVDHLKDDHQCEEANINRWLGASTFSEMPPDETEEKR